MDHWVPFTFPFPGRKVIGRGKLMLLTCKNLCVNHKKNKHKPVVHWWKQLFNKDEGNSASAYLLWLERPHYNGQWTLHNATLFLDHDEAHVSICTNRNQNKETIVNNHYHTYASTYLLFDYEYRLVILAGKSRSHSKWKII